MSTIVQQPDQADHAHLAITSEQIGNHVAANVKEAMAENRQLMERLSAERPSLLQRLIPDPLLREKSRRELAIVRSELEFRERTLNIVREAQVQALAGVYTSFLLQSRTYLQQKTAEYVLNRRQELEASITAHYEAKIASLNREYTNALKLPSEKLKEMEIQRIDESFVLLKQDTDTLLRQFSEILRTTLDKMPK